VRVKIGSRFQKNSTSIFIRHIVKLGRRKEEWERGREEVATRNQDANRRPRTTSLTWVLPL
jgi:hypothetical protein